MARIRAFDEAYVLEQAMETFWAKGYEATSVDDLVAATGISKSSLYGAFGNKHGLFEAALGFYTDTRVQAMLGGLEHGVGGIDEVVAFFDVVVQIAEEFPDRGALGCLLTNSITELAYSDPRISQSADEYIDRLTNAFAAAVERSERSGELTPGGAAWRAQVLGTLALGLFVRRRGNPDPSGAIAVAQAVRNMVESWRSELK
jgi:TetR/AcrR family transcriptional repressor of nem operon